MKLNLVLVATIILLLLVALHTVLWVNHTLAHHKEDCTCYQIPYEAHLMLVSFAISAFLSLIAVLAYMRDGRKALLLISTAYLLLLIHCVFWFLGLRFLGLHFYSGSAEHTIFHSMGVLLLIFALALMILALRKRQT